MRPIFINFCARYLWPWRSDTLCTSGFMDDVMFAHKPRLLDVAAHAALGLAIVPVAGQRTHENTFRALEKVTSRVASTGAESVQSLRLPCIAVASGWSAEAEEAADVERKKETARAVVAQQGQPALLRRRRLACCPHRRTTLRHLASSGRSRRARVNVLQQVAYCGQLDRMLSLR